MGAQLLCKQKVGGSSPLSSTKYALGIQLDRVSSYELESQEFESSLAHQYIGT